MAIVSDKFPRTGAVALSIMGGIGMMAGGVRSVAAKTLVNASCLKD